MGRLSSFLFLFGFQGKSQLVKTKLLIRLKQPQRNCYILVSASGQILVSNLMNVDSQVSGVVKTVYVKDGQKVYAGQAIASVTLDSEGALANAKGWATLRELRIVMFDSGVRCKRSRSS